MPSHKSVIDLTADDNDDQSVRTPKSVPRLRTIDLLDDEEPAQSASISTPLQEYIIEISDDESDAHESPIVDKTAQERRPSSRRPRTTTPEPEASSSQAIRPKSQLGTTPIPAKSASSKACGPVLRNAPALRSMATSPATPQIKDSPRSVNLPKNFAPSKLNLNTAKKEISQHDDGALGGNTIQQRQRNSPQQNDQHNSSDEDDRPTLSEENTAPWPQRLRPDLQKGRESHIASEDESIEATDVGLDELMRDADTSSEHNVDGIPRNVGLSPQSSSSLSNADTGEDLFPVLTQRRNQRQLNTSTADSGVRTESPKFSSDDETRAVFAIAKTLKTLERNMKENHAVTVRFLLEDARECETAQAASRLKFQDEIDPFKDLKPINYPPGDPALKGMKTVIKKGTNNKSTKILNKIISTSFISDVCRVPKFYALTIVKRNILSEDDEKLRFIPYFGDDEAEKIKNQQKMERELESIYKPNGDTISRMDFEKVSRLRSNIDSWLPVLQLGVTRRELEHSLLLQDKNLGKNASETVTKVFRSPLSEESRHAAILFSTAFKNVFGVTAQKVLLPRERLNELTDQLKKPPRKSLGSRTPIDGLETYASLTCLICSALECQIHGEYIWDRAQDGEDDRSEEPIKYLTFPQKLTIQPTDLIRKHEERLSKLNDEEESPNIPVTQRKACSSDCYLLVDPANKPPYTWSDQEISDIYMLLITMTGHSDRQSCELSFAWDLPCWQVCREIERYEREKPWTIEPPLIGQAKRPDWYDNKKKVLKGDWRKSTNMHLHQENTQANPCAHAGPCGLECPCVNSNILCEDLCSCSDDCPRRFTGCSCALAGINCNSDSCICIQLNRECGPRCGSCGAVPRINPVNKCDNELFKTGCQNVSLQRGISVTTVIGESQLEGTGYGLYTAEPIQKGCFISEYTGELISSGEAERRGVIYDRKLLSFLFDLNNEWVIDGARLGNKTRFINHASSEADGLNVEAKILFINGEHRIKFIALRDIEVGEELLFNYGRKFAEKQGLSKKLPKNTRKGVVVGEEALDALDGMDASKRSVRGTMTAIRGDRGGSQGKRQKARKVAPMIAESEDEVNTFAVQETNDDGERGVGVEDDDDDDDDEGDALWSRPKRKRHIPVKYTK